MTANELKSTVETISEKTDTRVSPDLKKWRDRLNLSPQGMADYLGVPVHTFLKWQKSERKPPAAALALFQILQMAETLAPALHEALMPKKGDK
jgi:DNA-binding transcriptional regulator YiaG